jgi:phosphonate transport system substrate-binding protein
MALPWLDLLLAEQGAGRAEIFMERITESTKLSAVVLPVFFGQADACLVTLGGFSTMAELNPQLERELRVLAKSQSLVPMVSFLRRDFTPSFRQELIEAICQLHMTASGRQILNLMQGDEVVVIPSPALESTRELMHRWMRQAMNSNVQNIPARGGERPAQEGSR